MCEPGIVHAEGVLMVALRTMNLPPEAWQSAKLLRAILNGRLVLMTAYHIMSPALSAERRLVQIGGRLPTANQLHHRLSKS